MPLSVLTVKTKKNNFRHTHNYLVVVFLWGVAVLGLDSHPDHNKESDACTLP